MYNKTLKGHILTCYQWLFLSNHHGNLAWLWNIMWTIISSLHTAGQREVSKTEKAKV